MNKKVLSLLMMLMAITAQQIQAVDWSQYYNAVFTKNNGIAVGVGCAVAAAGLLHAREAYISMYNGWKREQYQTNVSFWKLWQKLPDFYGQGSLATVEGRNAYYITAGLGAIAGVVSAGATKLALNCYSEAS